MDHCCIAVLDYWTIGLFYEMHSIVQFFRRESQNNHSLFHCCLSPFLPLNGTMTNLRKCPRQTAIYIVAVTILMSQLLWMFGIFPACHHNDTLHPKEILLLRSANNDPTKEDTNTNTNHSIPIIPFRGPTRIFRTWNYTHRPFPCFPAEDKWRTPAVVRSPTQKGLLFLRNMKTGSSTLGGITIRIARSMARFVPNITTDLCKVRFDHTPARLLHYGQRDQQQSFLFSFLRNPKDRVLSEFFHFGVSRFKNEPTFDNFKNYLNSRYFLNNYFLWDMGFGNFNGSKATWMRKKQVAHDIIHGYDFIGLMERMDESLVVLKMLLNLQFNDILYLSAKGNGGFDDGAYKGKCHYIVPSYISPAMKEFFDGPIWEQWSDGDTWLYNAANHSLDLTIQALGNQEVKRQVVEYQRLQKIAKERCLPTTIQPCTSDGVYHKNNHNCLFWDSGCGYECLDSLREIEPDGFPNPNHAV